MEGRILVIDDVQDDCDLLSTMLQREGAQVVTTTSVVDALERIGREDFDVVLTDLGMQEIGGLEVCQRVGGMNPNLPVIVVTGEGSMDAAISAMRAGAYDFITKPIDSTLLALSVARATQHRHLHAEVRRLRDAMKVTGAPDGIG